MSGAKQYRNLILVKRVAVEAAGERMEARTMVMRPLGRDG
jgi:hypothetical protein